MVMCTLRPRIQSPEFLLPHAAVSNNPRSATSEKRFHYQTKKKLAN